MPEKDPQRRHKPESDLYVHKVELQVCPRVIHSFGVLVISSHVSAMEEKKSTLVRVDAERVDAQSDAVLATSGLRSSH